MQLSPLQSRLAASLIASCLLMVVYLFFFFPQFATATQLDGGAPPNHDDDASGWINDGMEQANVAMGGIGVEELSYEPDFGLFDRSIIGRAPAGTTGLLNNEPWTSNIQPGETIRYVFEVSSVEDSDTSDSKRLRELRRSPNESEQAGEGEDPASDGLEVVRRQEPTKTLWISANTCQQPSRIDPDQTTMDPPQLSLFVSKSSDNTEPGPEQGEDEVEFIPFEQGIAMFNTTLTEDVFFSIHAPEVSSEYFDTALPYNYEVAVSVDQSFHALSGTEDSELIWIDSDDEGALLSTGNITTTPEEKVETMPYIMFANNKDDLRINGLRNSYCGLKREAQIRVPEDGKSGQITTGLRQGGFGNLTKQEFYISGLNASSQYVGILVRDPGASSPDRRRDSPGGGGIVFRETEMSTKPKGACRVIFNLTLCDESQYAVPANAELFPKVTDLEQFYDNYTRTMYENFEKSLQQVQCEAEPAERYSMVRDCDDCRQAYKNWLCSVAVPRCEDFSEPGRPSLQPRNIDKPFPNGSFVEQALRDEHGDERAWTSSRNPLIDEKVQPGPYKEVLPCDDVCYELVQSCPASLGFSCPTPGSIGFNVTYGQRTSDGGVSCNYPGSAHYPAGTGRLAVPWLVLLAGTASAVLFVFGS